MYEVFHKKRKFPAIFGALLCVPQQRHCGFVVHKIYVFLLSELIHSDSKIKKTPIGRRLESSLQSKSSLSIFSLGLLLR